MFGLNGFQVNFEHNPSRDSNMGLKLYYTRLKQCLEMSIDDLITYGVESKQQLGWLKKVWVK